MASLRRRLPERLATGALVGSACGLGLAAYLAVKPLSKPASTDTHTSSVPAAPQEMPPALSLTESDLRLLGGQSQYPQQPGASPITGAQGEGVPFSVCGIIHSTRGSSIAFIRVGKDLKLCRTGDVVDGWTLSKIEPYAAIFERGERQIRCQLEGPKYESAATAAASPTARPAGAAASVHPALRPGERRVSPVADSKRVVSVATSSSAPSAPVVRPVAQSRGAEVAVAVARQDAEMAREIAARAAADPVSLLKEVSVEPLLVKGGGMQGLALRAVPAGSLAARYGLAPGDKILAVNGQPLDSAERIFELYHRYRNSDSVTITLERAGQRKEVVFYVR